MAITLTAVAATDKRMMNLEKDFCLLKAMRLAMNKARFNGMVLVNTKTNGWQVDKFDKFIEQAYNKYIQECCTFKKSIQLNEIFFSFFSFFLLLIFSCTNSNARCCLHEYQKHQAVFTKQPAECTHTQFKFIGFDGTAF